MDLRHYADIEKWISGSLSLTDLPRLAKLLESGGSAEFELNFSRDESRRVQVNGRITAELVLQCQRCLGAVSMLAEREIHLVVVDGLDEAEQLPAAVDPLLIEENTRLRLHDLLEDELILALPQAAMHKQDECRAVTQHIIELEPADEDGVDRANPFAELAKLKE